MVETARTLGIRVRKLTGLIAGNEIVGSVRLGRRGRVQFSYEALRARLTHEVEEEENRRAKGWPADDVE